jgi:hypothetical protein
VDAAAIAPIEAEFRRVAEWVRNQAQD